MKVTNRFFNSFFLIGAILMWSCTEEDAGAGVDMAQLDGKWSITSQNITTEFLGISASESFTYQPNLYTYSFDGSSLTEILVEEGVWYEYDYTVDGNVLMYNLDFLGTPVPVTITFTTLTDSQMAGTLELTDPLFGSKNTSNFSGTRNTGTEAGILESDFLGSWNITSFEEFEDDVLQAASPDNPEGLDVSFESGGAGLMGEIVDGVLLSYEFLDMSNIVIISDEDGDQSLADEEPMLLHVKEVTSNTLKLVNFEVEEIDIDVDLIRRVELTLTKNL